MANPCGDATPCGVAWRQIGSLNSGNPLEEAKRKGCCTGPFKSLIWLPRTILGRKTRPCDHYFAALQNDAKHLKNDWNAGTLVLIWEYSVKVIQWIPTWQGLGGFQKSLHTCALDQSSLSIGRVKQMVVGKVVRNRCSHIRGVHIRSFQCTVISNLNIIRFLCALLILILSMHNLRKKYFFEKWYCVILLQTNMYDIRPGYPIHQQRKWMAFSHSPIHTI